MNQIETILKDPIFLAYAAIFIPLGVSLCIHIYKKIKKIINSYRASKLEASNAELALNNKVGELYRELNEYFQEQLEDVDFWGTKNLDMQAAQLENLLMENQNKFDNLGLSFSNLYKEYKDLLDKAPLRNQNNDESGLFDEDDYSYYPEYEDKEVKAKIREINSLLLKIKGA